jgi:hypothetical protein
MAKPNQGIAADKNIVQGGYVVVWLKVIEEQTGKCLAQLPKYGDTCGTLQPPRHFSSAHTILFICYIKIAVSKDMACIDPWSS